MGGGSDRGGGHCGVPICNGFEQKSNSVHN